MSTLLCLLEPKSIELSVLVLCLLLTASAQQLSPSQSKTLLRLQRLLEFPSVLATWTNHTDLCSLPSSTSLSIACSGDHVTHLAIVGGRQTALSSTFSSDSLFITLSRLPSLTDSLFISKLRHPHLNGESVLPGLLKNKNKVGSESPFNTAEDSDHGSLGHGEKEDIYQLGVVLLEIITGKPAESQSELDSLRVQLQKSVTDDSAKLKVVTDPAICGTFALDSLRTAAEITLNCVSKEPSMRPSIDYVLWH